MKKGGIVGGLGPESTIDYYQSVISKFQEKMGSKDILPEFFINSINMYKLFQLIEDKKENELVDYLVSAVFSLEKAGADFVVLSANTPHIVFNQVQEKVKVPMISIVEETFKKAKALGINKIGLLGTKFTMKNDFFQKVFYKNNMDITVPNSTEQNYIHEKIVSELEKGIVNQETKKEFLTIMNGMLQRDEIEGIILGCTELPLMFKPDDFNIPLLNTTEIHVNKIVETILNEK